MSQLINIHSLSLLPNCGAGLVMQWPDSNLGKLNSCTWQSLGLSPDILPLETTLFHSAAISLDTGLRWKERKVTVVLEIIEKLKDICGE